MYGRIFGLCAWLLKLEIEDDDIDVLSLSRPLFSDLSSPIFGSSKIIYLCIRIQNIDGCLYIFGGHLSQLQTLIVHLDYIHDPVLISRHLSQSLHVDH